MDGDNNSKNFTKSKEKEVKKEEEESDKDIDNLDETEPVNPNSGYPSQTELVAPRKNDEEAVLLEDEKSPLLVNSTDKFGAGNRDGSEYNYFYSMRAVLIVLVVIGIIAIPIAVMNVSDHNGFLPLNSLSNVLISLCSYKTCKFNIYSGASRSSSPLKTLTLNSSKLCEFSCCNNTECRSFSYYSPSNGPSTCYLYFIDFGDWTDPKPDYITGSKIMFSWWNVVWNVTTMLFFVVVFIVSLVYSCKPPLRVYKPNESDYTIKVSNIPTSLSDPLALSKFFTAWGQVSVVSLVTADEGVFELKQKIQESQDKLDVLIAKHKKTFNQTEEIKTQQRELSDLQSKLLQLLSEQANNIGTGFVTFTFEYGAVNCVNDYNPPGCCGYIMHKLKPKTPAFEGVQLEVTSAKQSGDIHRQNLAVPLYKRNLRTILAFFLSQFTVYLSLIIVIVLAEFKNYFVDDDPSSSNRSSPTFYLGVILGVLNTIVNILSSMVIEKIVTSVTRSHSQTANHSMGISFLSLNIILNTVIPLIVIGTQNNQLVDIAVTSLTISYISDIVVSTIIMDLINPIHRLKSLIKTKLADTQKEVDEAGKKPDFPLVSKYANTLALVGIALIFCDVIPHLVPLAFIAVICRYFAESHLLKRFYKPITGHAHSTVQALFREKLIFILGIKIAVMWLSFFQFMNVDITAIATTTIISQSSIVIICVLFVVDLIVSPILFFKRNTAYSNQFLIAYNKIPNVASYVSPDLIHAQVDQKANNHDDVCYYYVHPFPAKTHPKTYKEPLLRPKTHDCSCCSCCCCCPSKSQ